MSKNIDFTQSAEESHLRKNTTPTELQQGWVGPRERSYLSTKGGERWRRTLDTNLWSLHTGTHIHMHT